MLTDTSLLVLCARLVGWVRVVANAIEHGKMLKTQKHIKRLLIIVVF